MEYTYTLPHGYIDLDGSSHKQVVLRALGGYEEELLTSSQQVSAKQVSRVLARCIVKLGDVVSVSESIARNLLIVDRLFLLLKLRLITFGDFIQSVVHCPESDCNQKIDIDFNISDIQFADINNPREIYQLQLSENSVLQCEIDDPRVDFRLPNGGDQELVSSRLNNNSAEVVSFLLSRCIKKFAGQDGISLDQVKTLPALTRLEIERAIEERAGDTDLSMTTQCPHCQFAFEVPFDIHDFFFGELKISQQHLYNEVHYLAFHYHWSEQEIMSMTKEKRGNYVAMLSEEIERLNDALA